jgi:hypothetical protein
MIHERRIGNDVEGCGRDLIQDAISAFAWRVGGKLRKTSVMTGSPNRDLNPGPPEYELRVLTTRPQPSFVTMTFPSRSI